MILAHCRQYNTSRHYHLEYVSMQTLALYSVPYQCWSLLGFGFTTFVDLTSFGTQLSTLVFSSSYLYQLHFNHSLTSQWRKIVPDPAGKLIQHQLSIAVFWGGEREGEGDVWPNQHCRHPWINMSPDTIWHNVAYKLQASIIRVWCVILFVNQQWSSTEDYMRHKQQCNCQLSSLMLGCWTGIVCS